MERRTWEAWKLSVQGEQPVFIAALLLQRGRYYGYLFPTQRC